MAFGERRGAAASRAAGGNPAAASRSPVEDGLLSQVMRRCKPIVSQPHQVLFREGDDAENVYLLLEGIVRLFRFFPKGDRVVGAFVFPNQFIGLSFETSYPFTAEAIGRVLTCRIKRSHLAELSKASERLQGDILAELRHYASVSDENVLPLLHQTAEARVARFIESVARSTGARVENGAQIHLVMTRGDIADYLGLTIETVCRAFSKLKSDGVIRPLSHGVIIQEARLLAALAEGEI